MTRHAVNFVPKTYMRRKGKFCYRTDIGQVRLTNEDQALILANPQGDILMVVCDGMGGHNKGDLAAKMTLDIVAKAFRGKPGFINITTAKWWLYKTIKEANRQIYELAESDPANKEMGTTIVAALVKGNQVAIANIGDSRAYIVTNDGLKQLTEDQTYVDFLYRAGKITKEEEKNHPQKHVLLNALGITPSVSLDIDIYTYENTPIMLCSDGLYNNVSDKEIFTVLKTSDSVNQKCDTLIDIANSNGGTDNIAVALWEAEK